MQVNGTDYYTYLDEYVNIIQRIRRLPLPRRARTLTPTSRDKRNDRHPTIPV